MLSLLHAIWQADGTFPSGSFAFSNGVEGAAALGGLDGSGSLAGLVATALRHRWATADRRVLVQAHRAGEHELDRVAAIDRGFDAASLAMPLREGSRRNGLAFLTAHDRLGTPGARHLRRAVAEGRMVGHLPVLQGWLWARLGIGEREAALASGYAVASGLVAAAVRLGRRGAIEAQATLRDVLPLVAELAEQPVAAADEPASFVPWLDIAATRGARADLRLFAN